jgi:hypothetical protein
MTTTFFRLLQAEDKEAALRAVVDAENRGEDAAEVFRVDPVSFEKVPGSPFAYWVSERVRRLFRELPPVESDGRAIRIGLQTSDDFRFVRCWWEAAAHKILDGMNGPNWQNNFPQFQQ